MVVRAGDHLAAAEPLSASTSAAADDMQPQGGDTPSVSALSAGGESEGEDGAPSRSGGPSPQLSSGPFELDLLSELRKNTTIAMQFVDLGFLGSNPKVAAPRSYAYWHALCKTLPYREWRI